MNLKNKKVFLTRPYKVVYKDGDCIIKVFTKEHGKANVFNEALCQARVEESGLGYPEGPGSDGDRRRVGCYH